MELKIIKLILAFVSYEVIRYFTSILILKFSKGVSKKTLYTLASFGLISPDVQYIMCPDLDCEDCKIWSCRRNNLTYCIEKRGELYYDGYEE